MSQPTVWCFGLCCKKACASLRMQIYCHHNIRNRAADVFATFNLCFFLLCAWLLNSVRGISWAAVARCGHTALSGRPSAGLIGLALYLFSSSCMHSLQTQTCSAASFTIYTGKLISKSRLVCERVIQPLCSFSRSASVVGIMRKSALTFNGFFLSLYYVFFFSSHLTSFLWHPLVFSIFPF